MERMPECRFYQKALAEWTGEKFVVRRDSVERGARKRVSARASASEGVVGSGEPASDDGGKSSGWLAALLVALVMVGGGLLYLARRDWAK